MGMDYTYAGSASYDRFEEELTKVADVFCGKRIKTEEGEPLKFTFPKDTNETLVNWFNNSFGEWFTYEDTFIVWQIISHNNLIKNISPQIWRELEGCVNNHTGWDIR